MSKIVAIIPARLKSERFPEKHLKNFNGKPIIENVIEYTKKLNFVDRIVLAIEDEKLKKYEDIVDEIFFMEPRSARCGSERAYRYYLSNNEYDYYITIPADEPAIDPNELNKNIYNLLNILKNESVGTFYTKFYNQDDIKDLRSCKIVTNKEKVLYFSRSIIPISKNGQISDSNLYKKHVGVFVFSQQLFKLSGQELWGSWNSALSDIESLEQNRFLEFGLDVLAQEMNHIGFGIDTYDQIEKLEKRINQNT